MNLDILQSSEQTPGHFFLIFLRMRFSFLSSIDKPPTSAHEVVTSWIRKGTRESTQGQSSLPRQISGQFSARPNGPLHKTAKVFLETLFRISVQKVSTVNVKRLGSFTPELLQACGRLGFIFPGKLLSLRVPQDHKIDAGNCAGHWRGGMRPAVSFRPQYPERRNPGACRQGNLFCALCRNLRLQSGSCGISRVCGGQQFRGESYRSTWSIAFGAIFSLAGFTHFALKEEYENIFPVEGAWGVCS